MMDGELTNLVDELLYLVEVGSGSEGVDEAELAHLLDRLALAIRHAVAPDERRVPLEIPPRNLEVLSKVAASRFPSFGVYNRATDLTAHAREVDLTSARATDDVAVIADHLHVVAWLWRNRTWEDGLWYLDTSHRDHWGLAMRTLQLYLHARSAARERESAPR